MLANDSSPQEQLGRPREPWFLRSCLRLYAVLFLALAAPAGLAGLVAVDVQSQLRRQAEKENALVASMVAHSANEQFRGLMLYVRSYADRIRFSEAVRERDTTFVRRILSQLVEGNSFISRTFCADTLGALWLDVPSDPAVSGRNFAHRNWFRGISAGAGVYVSEIYRRDALGQPYIVTVAARIYDLSHVYCGILVAQVTVEDLAKWFFALDLPRGGIVSLVDQNGHWIHNGGQEVQLPDVGESHALDSLLVGRTVTREMNYPATGEVSQISAAPIPSAGWSVVARQPLRAVLAPVRSSQRTLLIYFILCLLVMLLISGRMYRTLRRYDRERDLAQDRLQRAYRDVEERVRQRTSDLTKANRELMRLAVIVESSNDAIGSLTLDGIITSWNPSAERIYGYTRADILGQPATVLLPADRENETPRLLAQLAAGANIEPFETVRRRRDGGLINVSLSLSPVHDDTGTITGVSVISRDITRQKEMEEQAQRLEQERAELLERLQMTLERMPIGCMLNDTELRFTYWNPAAENIFGYRFAEVKGKRPFGIITPESSQAHVTDVFRRLAEGETAADAVSENMTRDGRTIMCVWNNTSLRGRDGRFLGTISMCQDITLQKQDEERLRLYAAALAQNNRELQDFAFVASHDLQEPLRKIVAFGERAVAASGAELNEESREYLERMQKAARRMQTLIDDLLDFSRVTTRAEPFTPTDLRSVAAEVLSDIEARIEQTMGRVEIGDLPTIEADRVQMRQLLQNLIANALKFHRRDAVPVVRVGSRLLPTPVGGLTTEGSCELTVQDNGIGFDPRFVDRIFTQFQRLHGRHEYEGTGMGLAICRKIVERHNGTITATSTPGEGSCFIVTLPLKQPAFRNPQAASRLVELPATRGQTDD